MEPKPSRPSPLIVQLTLRKLFEYDPAEPFAFRWKTIQPQAKGRISIGDVAGYWHRYRAGDAAYRRYVDLPGRMRRRVPTHHAVWIYFYGTEPPRSLGFKSGDPADCRIENLIPNARRASDDKLKEARKGYNGNFKRSFTKEEWKKYIRKRNLMIDYNITEEEWQLLFDSQEGVCAICKNPETQIYRGKPRELSVDHCHGTGKVRGLLCGNCNNGIGRFRHDPARLRAAIAYLENS